MVGCYADVIISSMKVKFGVNLGGAQLVNKIGDQGNRVAVALGNTIEVVKIHTKLECAVFLLCKEDWPPPGELDAQMKPFLSISYRNSQRVLSLVPDRGVMN